jgi:3-hydroxyisobutyrate dehydrogenase
MSLALELAREAGVPMQIGQLAFAELERALERGWSERDFRAAMTLQEERAGVSVRVAPDALAEALKD